MDRHSQTTALSRRTFLTTTSAVLVGATLGRLAPQSEAAKRHPKWSGTCTLACVTTLVALTRIVIINSIPTVSRRPCTTA